MPSEAPPPTGGPAWRVLVAEADAEVGKAIAECLGPRGIVVELVHDGSDALLRLFRNRYDLAVLGGHLSGPSSPVIAEVLRRTTERRELPLVRVTPMDEPIGAPEFDANDAVEPGDLPTALVPILSRHGVGREPFVPEPVVAPPAPQPEPVIVTPPEPQPVVAAPPEPVAAPEPPAPEPEPPVAAAPQAPANDTPPVQAAPEKRRRRRAPPLSDDPEIAAAERLARIAVSDVILYNEEKFAQSVKDGNVIEAMSVELEETRAHFNGRIPEEVRVKRDFLVEEFERRATQASS